MKRLLVFSAFSALLLGSGCTTGLRGTPSARPPGIIDWQNPVSVMRGFLSAKKRGDWRTAYRCCDYKETLSKDQQARIKKKWKQESKNWPFEYVNTYWDLTETDYDRATARVRILVYRRDSLTRGLKPGETYEETLKKNKDEWKITSLLAGKPPQ